MTSRRPVSRCEGRSPDRSVRGKAVHWLPAAPRAAEALGGAYQGNPQANLDTTTGICPVAEVQQGGNGAWRSPASRRLRWPGLHRAPEERTRCKLSDTRECVSRSDRRSSSDGQSLRRLLTAARRSSPSRSASPAVMLRFCSTQKRSFIFATLWQSRRANSIRSSGRMSAEDNRMFIEGVIQSEQLSGSVFLIRRFSKGETPWQTYRHG